MVLFGRKQFLGDSWPQCFGVKTLALSELVQNGKKNLYLSFGICLDQRVAYRLGKLSNAEISGFSASRRVSRVEPPISSTFDKLGEGSAGEGTLARW